MENASSTNDGQEPQAGHSEPPDAGQPEGEKQPQTYRPGETGRPNEPTPLAALLTGILAPAAVFGALVLYASRTAPLDIIRLELAGTVAAAQHVIPPPEAAGIEQIQNALRWDLPLIAAYSLAIVAVCYLGSRIFITSFARQASSLMIAAGGIAGVMDLVENGSLALALELWSGGLTSFFLTAAAVCATVKFALLLPALPFAMVASVALAKRAGGHFVRCRRATKSEQQAVWLPSPVLRGPGRWPTGTSAVVKPPHGDGAAIPLAPNAYWGYSGMVPGSRDPASVGFCVSGGGIRSACVTLGALQRLRTQLLRARYLVSVSGGGYMTGAMRLALEPVPKPEGSEKRPPPTARPENVYCEGTVEEDHTRRHGKYIADGLREWLGALWTLLRGLFGSLTLLAGTVVVAGLALSFYYEEIDFFEVSALRSYFIEGGEVLEERPAFPTPLGTATKTLLTLAGLGVGIRFLSTALIDRNRFRRTHSKMLKVAVGLVSLASIVGMVLYVLPVITWGSAYITWLARNETGSGTSWAAAGGAVSLLFTYAGALVSIAWRNRKKIGDVAKKAGDLSGTKEKKKKDKVAAVEPSSRVQLAIVCVVLLMLSAIGLLLLGITIATGTTWPKWAVVGIPAVLLILHLRLDQTWMSLHPFYRKRLASAFAVRRKALPDDDVVAEPYDFENETTLLSSHAKWDAESDFPQVIFSCAANLSGPERTPPGRRATSFTMSGDFIGGPHVGYVRSVDAEVAASGAIGADLTVQAAVAISGAAFASAMGAQARPIQTLLAISNARLGTWLPNPAYLAEIWEKERPWWAPDLPPFRRLTYLFREIFGHYPSDDRLLFVTDGGHYDNLGLVELLRHKCRTVYCIDASGDTPPFPQTLLQAITLAQEELGIRIDLTDARDLLPGSAEGLLPPLDQLAGRMSRKAVITGKICYPQEFQTEAEAKTNTPPSKEGTLIFAKAVLTPDMPAALWGYAQSKAGFPRDGTGDQWFTQDQFNAYQRLGQFIGEEALKVAP